MTKTTCMLWLAAGLTLTAATPSGAQTPPSTQSPQTDQTPPPATQPPPTRPPKSTTTAVPTKNLFIDINGGYQAASHDFTATSTPTIYDEQARIVTSQKVGGGGLFDIAAGYRVWHDIAVSLGFTYAGNKSDAQVAASIPNPVFFDQPVTRTLTAPGLKHTEDTINLDLVWSSPINDRMDAALSFGPSFIHVKQDVVTSVNVVNGTQDVSGPVTESQSKTAVGFNIGGDFTYLLQPRVGVGAMARYVYGKTDLTSVNGLTLGGFQIGGGVRLRF
jgi:Outer membrane protein beta-barrel domain